MAKYDEDFELMKALEESASLHRQNITDLKLATKYDKTRAEVEVSGGGFPCREGNAGRYMRQINTINQFHPRWNALIRK